MAGENPYRAMLLALILLLAPIGLYFRLRSFTGEPLARRDEGLVVMIALCLGGVMLWIGLLAYLYDPAWPPLLVLRLPAWLRWLGLPLGVVAILWCTWMLHSLGPNLTDTVNVRISAGLVTTGPYRYVRHPMYLGVGALMLSVSLITASVWIACAAILGFTMLVLRTPTEERKLVVRFGEDYRQYAERTGRFLPRLPTRRTEGST